MRVPRRTLQSKALDRRFQRDGFVIAPCAGADEVAAALDVFERFPSGIDDGYYASIHSSDPTYKVNPPLRTDEAHLRETLKRCSPATFAAVRAFRATGDYAHLPAIVTGVIERFVERELREKLLSADPAPAELRLIEDLGLDSLTLMEIVILTEDVLPVTINNDELRHLRTLGDVQSFITAKLRALQLPTDLTAPAHHPH